MVIERPLPPGGVVDGCFATVTGGALEEANGAPVILERNGARFRVSRVEDDL
jgi:hypothetical protein